MSARPSPYKNYVQALNSLFKEPKSELGKIVFLYGTSDFLLTRTADAITENFATKGGGCKTNLHMHEINEDVIEQLLAPASLFDSRSSYSIQCRENVSSMTKFLTRLAEAGPLYNDITIGFLAKAPGVTATKILKGLKALTINCAEPRFRELETFVGSLAKKLGILLSPQSVSFVLANVGNDLFRLENELKKLATIFHDLRDQELSPKQLAPYLGVIKEDHAFSLDNLLLDRQYAEAEALIADLLARGESAIAINAIIARFSRNCLKVREAAQTAANPKQLAQSTGIHPGIVWRFADHAKKYKSIGYEKILFACQATDLKLKSSRTSDRLIMANLMIEMREA